MKLLAPEDDDYDLARLGWNRSIDCRPAVIAGAESIADVRTAVRLARGRDLPLAVRATGHGTVAATDGALLLRTGHLRELHIDPVRRTARAGPGVVWDDVNRAAERYGLAALAGRCSSVGVTGYTLGGGTGWLSRRFGYAADSVISAEVVTADGRLVHASADENPDLFWALRGGGGSFGIVASLEFRLYPAPAIWGGQSLYPLERAEVVFAAYREWAPGEPDELNSAVLVLRPPGRPPVLAIRAFHLGDEASGRKRSTHSSTRPAHRRTTASPPGRLPRRVRPRTAPTFPRSPCASTPSSSTTSRPRRPPEPRPTVRSRSSSCGTGRARSPGHRPTPARPVRARSRSR